MSRNAAGLVVCGALCLLRAGASAAFEIDGLKWPTPITSIQVNVPGPADNPTLWRDALVQAARDWSRSTEFAIAPELSNASDPCVEPDFRNGVAFATQLCDNVAFGETTLAITFTFLNAAENAVAETDILFNQNKPWAVYSGPLRTENDFRRVAAHELGHVIGLGHEAVAQALMAPFISGVEQPAPDDILGVNTLYASNLTGPGPNGCGIAPEIGRNDRVDASLSALCTFERLTGEPDNSSALAYRVVLPVGGELGIEMTADYDTYLAIYDSTVVNQFALDDDSGSGTNSRLLLALPEGEYVVIANAFSAGDTGAFTLTTSFRSPQFNAVVTSAILMLLDD